MSRKARILFSARDPGAVGHILALVAAFRKDGRFDVDLVASGVALDLLTRAGESLRFFTLADGRDHLQEDECPEPLLEVAGQLLAVSQPDAVFVSLSSFGVGVDEALLACAEVPTFAMQDFSGDVNLGLGVRAGLYFALDEYAVRLSRERWGVHAVAVGSPKHSRYADLDVMALRYATRRSLQVGDDKKIIGFFGQSPMIPGHESAFQDLVKAMAALRSPPLLLLREHPKLPTLQDEHISIGKEVGLSVIDATNSGETEPWLAACDVMVTPFSSCGLDYAYLSAYSQEPIGSVLYLMTNDELRAFTERVCGITHFPIVEQGMGRVVQTPDEILPSLEGALSSKCATTFFSASKSLPKGNPCRIILRTVTQILSIDGVASNDSRCVTDPE